MSASGKGTINDTPENFADDTGLGIVAGTTSFTQGSQGTLDGGSRFSSITNVTLNPGAYTIVADGFNFEDDDDEDDNNDDLPGNTGSGEEPLPPPSTINMAGGVLDFVGFGRFGGTGFPPNVDTGPANRYHAGTFKYDLSADELLLEVNTLSGAMRLLNEGTGSFDLDFYEINSTNTSSLVNSWSGLSGSLTDWAQGGASNDSSLSETNLANFTTLGSSASQSLGTGYNTAVAGQDLVFSYSTADGTDFLGQIRYVSTASTPGDFDEDGDVDGFDFLKWQRGESPVPLSQDDLADWEANYGTVTPLSATATAVPEPSGGLLMCLAAAALLYFGQHRRHRVVRSVALSATMMLSVAFFVARPADAASTLDRNYRFENNTTDSASPATNLTASGGPSFINITTTSANLLQARPFAADDGSTFGIEMDGSNDLLRGSRLGQPESSVDSLLHVPPGTEDYQGINDRGFQLWVYANSAGMGTEQDVVLDTQQHGLRISSSGTWVMRYAGIDNDSEVSVAFDQWSHVMVVKPDTFNRSEMYVDGNLAAITSGGYDVSDDAELVVGANTDDDTNNVGMSGFFNGVLDDLELFVFGVSQAIVIDYGSYVFAEDNDFASKMLTGVDGDVNLDNDLTSADIDAMAAGWLNTKVVDGIQLGDLETRMLGDLDFDGRTDLNDVFLLREAFAAAAITLEPGAWDAFSANVPEPASGAMLLVAGLGLALWRYRMRGNQ